MPLGLLVALLLGFSQEVPAQDDVTDLPDISVSGVRPSVSQTRRFVDEVTTTPLHALTLARWMTPICVTAINMLPDAAAAIVTRIEDRARAVGIEVQGPGCSPTITILATSDGPATATDLVAAYPERFMASTGPTQGDKRALRRFAESEAAVRWWTISALRDDYTGRILVPIWDRPAPRANTNGVPYWGQNRREALLTTLVILDVSKTENVSPAVLGDYLSMAVLSPLDPDARAGGYPSILSMWDGAPTVTGLAATGLTPWDRAYLTALYEADVRLTGAELQARSLFQLNEMARIMARELAQADRRP